MELDGNSNIVTVMGVSDSDVCVNDSVNSALNSVSKEGVEDCTPDKGKEVESGLVWDQTVDSGIICENDELRGSVVTFPSGEEDETGSEIAECIDAVCCDELAAVSCCICI